MTNNSVGSQSELPKPRTEPPKQLRQSASQSSTEYPKLRASSELPPDFFDNETKRPKPGRSIGPFSVLSGSYSNISRDKNSWNPNCDVNCGISWLHLANNFSSV